MEEDGGEGRAEERVLERGIIYAERRKMGEEVSVVSSNDIKVIVLKTCCNGRCA